MERCTSNNMRVQEYKTDSNAKLMHLGHNVDSKGNQIHFKVKINKILMRLVKKTKKYGGWGAQNN